MKTTQEVLLAQWSVSIMICFEFFSLHTCHQGCSGTAVAVHFPRDISIPHGLMNPSSTDFKFICILQVTSLIITTVLSVTTIECLINQWSVIHIDIAYLHQQLSNCATLQINCRTYCLIQLCCDNALTGCCPNYLGLHLSSILYDVINQHSLNYGFAPFGSKILVSYHYMIFANKIVGVDSKFTV